MNQCYSVRIAVAATRAVLSSASVAYLRREGSGKADLEQVQASKGLIAGGAIRLDPVGPELLAGEGIETTAAAGKLLDLPAWAAVAANNMGRSLALPPEVPGVVIASDPNPVRAAAARSHQP